LLLETEFFEQIRNRKLSNLNIYREEDNLVCILSYCLLLLIMNNAMNTKKEILHNTLLT